MRHESGCTLSLFFSDEPYVDTECIVSDGLDDGDMLPNGMAVLPLLSACKIKTDARKTNLNSCNSSYLSKCITSSEKSGNVSFVKLSMLSFRCNCSDLLPPNCTRMSSNNLR